MAMRDLVAAEWLKLRTTRLLFGMAPAAVRLSFAAVVGSLLATDRSDISLRSTEGIERVLSFTGTGALVVLLVGILIAAGEYRHGTAADTFLTTPRRHPVVFAKLTVGAAVGAVAGLLTSAACVAAAALLFRIEGVTFPFDRSEVWLTLAGAVAYTTLFAVLGVALGTLVRNQVLAVAAALAWIGVVEHVLVALAPGIGRWLPAAAGQAIVRTPLDDLLPPLGGVAVLAAYALVIGALGVRFAVRRDV
jgi:ABC-2 type transport system permease protein